MSEEIKFDLDGDIIMQIEMDSYMKYNDTIASMNDHLGEIYGYSDVRDTEEAQLKYEKELAYKAIVQLQQKVEQLEKENKELNRMCELYSQSLYNADLTKAEKKVEQLENIRKEAIKYIKSYKNDYAPYELSDYNIREILNILNKGSNKE